MVDDTSIGETWDATKIDGIQGPTTPVDSGTVAFFIPCTVGRPRRGRTGIRT